MSIMYTIFQVIKVTYLCISSCISAAVTLKSPLLKINKFDVIFIGFKY